MPPIENNDDGSAAHRRDLVIPQRCHCSDDDDQFEYFTALGRNTFGIPPYCKGDWSGEEDWKPRQREGGAGDGYN